MANNQNTDKPPLTPFNQSTRKTPTPAHPEGEDSGQVCAKSKHPPIIPTEPWTSCGTEFFNNEVKRHLLRTDRHRTRVQIVRRVRVPSWASCKADFEGVQG